MTDVHEPAFHARLKRRASAALCCCLLGSLCATGAFSQGFFPLKDVHPGLHGTGKTVFQGDRVEDFQVEILGVLENPAPSQSIILARLSGGPLAETGVLQGMSGSPVYIDGKLLGAVALGFPYSKVALAGIQPIEQMLQDARFPPVAAAQSSHSRMGDSWSRDAAPAHLQNISTPLNMGGFTPGTLRAFAPQLEKLGFEPQQGVSGNSGNSQKGSGSIEPGSMISVQLMTGDMNVGADGTVTYIDGKRVYAFGHRFLATGSTDLPFARAEVIALVPDLNASFKLATAREWIGTMVSDRSTAIAGEIGRRTNLVPITVAVRPPAATPHEYHFQVVNDRFLTSFLTQAALYSAIDATQRILGAGTIRLRGRIEFDGSLPPLIVRDIFISDSGVPLQASANAVVALGFVMGAGFSSLHIKNVSFDLEPMESKRSLLIDQAWTSKHEVKPGDTIQITALLTGEDGLELTRSTSYQIPVGAPAGLLNLTISDANTLNFPDYAGLNPGSVRSADQLIRVINAFRGSDDVFVRVWRQEPSFAATAPLPGGEITDPPPSVALVLANQSSSLSGSVLLNTLRGAQVAELRIPVGDYAVSGAKTIQVEVKE